ncbi:hypothetical protein [Vibrio europaeus]|uniref:hypothetical protein n=1 Tax=Vibrio europaeus TaxID=300876 RepID=UPI00233F5347|nr:hypothetical protein [Vibrio europaeus]MDC5853824.1 hypothetical protein [Vibrio europaeus]
MEARNIITILILVSSILLLNLYPPTTEPLLSSILSSIFAACIFDFVIIRLPDEIKKKRYSENIGIYVLYIHTIKRSMLHALGNEDFVTEGIDRHNYQFNLEKYSRVDTQKNVESMVRFGDRYIQNLMAKRIEARQAQTCKTNISVNDYLCICIMLLNYVVDEILNKEELHHYPDVRVSILNLKSAIRNDTASTFINARYEAKQREIYDLGLNYSHRMEDLLDLYILPMETVEFWFVRKMRKYFRIYGIPNSTFSYQATQMHLKNMQDRISISL